MIEFLVANGHSLQAIEDYSFDRVKLFYKLATKRAAEEFLHNQRMLFDIVLIGSRGTPQAVSGTRKNINAALEKLIASDNPPGLLKGLAARLAKSGVPVKHG